MKAELRQMIVAVIVSARMSLACSHADEQGCDGQGSQESKGWTRRRESTEVSKGTEPAASEADVFPGAASADRSHNTSRRKSPPAQVCSHNRPTVKPKPLLQPRAAGSLSEDHPERSSRDGRENHGNDITVTTDDPYLRPWQLRN